MSNESCTETQKVESTASYYAGVIMASAIDYGTLAIGALIGVGCKDQLRSAAKVTASLAASLATSASAAVNAAAEQMSEDSQNPQAGQTNVKANNNGG